MPATIRKLPPEEILALTPDSLPLAPIFNNLELYASQNGSLLLADFDGHPAGLAALNYANPEFALIEHFVVSPQFRSHGIGSKLMNAALQDARARNAPAIRAHIPPWCPDWRSFYKRFKFQYLDPNAQSALTDTTPVELKL